MICCAPGCGHKSGNGCHFYNFPSPNDGPDWEKWYKIWVLRINRVNKNGELWRPETQHTKLCSCHFHPEQQWDPKSRKGGLKCKEPVFFEYNLDLSSLGPFHENAGVLSPGSSSSVENSGVKIQQKRIHHDSNPSTPPSTGSDEPAPKIRSTQSTQRKTHTEKSLMRSCSTAPKLKIREYFEQQDVTEPSQTIDPTVTNLSTSSKGPTEQQHLIPNARMPHAQYSQQGPRFVSADDQTEVACTQVMYPDVGHMDFLEVAGSVDNSDGSDTGYSSIQQQMYIKHEHLDSPEVVHVISGLPEQNPNPGFKIETACNPLRRDSMVVESDEEVLPRIISSHSLEPDVQPEERLTEGLREQRVSSLRQFVDADHHDSAPVPSKNPVQKTKISNVKPIRIFTPKRIGSGSKVSSHDTLSVGPLDREEIQTTSQTGTENVYDQIFSRLASPMAVSQHESSRASVSGDTTGSIEDMLSDHLNSTEPQGHLSLTQALERVKELEKALSIEKFGLHRFMASDEKIKFYTGFRSVDTLMRFFWRIEPDDLTSDRSSKWKDAVDFAKETLHNYQDFTEKTIPYMDELFLFLCHVWLGLQPEDLADRFALPSTKHALFIIMRWVYYLHVTLPIPTLRAQGTATSTSTKSVRFQGQFCNTSFLLQPVRIKVQQRSILNHLSSTRLNCLVCFSPSGEVVFTSDPLSDVSTSTELLQRTGILPLLQRGESIIVEGEFMREGVHLFSSVGVKVHQLPSFDLPHNAATFKRGPSHQDTHKCHTEVVRLLCAKFVRTLTAFKCLQDVVLDPVSHVIKALWKVCCLLVNYQQGFRSL
ncbi:uncharacterized protein LOC117291855 [Asterias rubens]|uniref:uncharacterized protein LOC117291855 n=1 Tax=Asterias rubens TaxID=7604 RepID=UPI0014553C2B|nr:uncharacterized protein LOC117291855 [Asterias rubens]